MSTAPGRFLATCRPAAIVFAMAGDLTRNASGVAKVMAGHRRRRVAAEWHDGQNSASHRPQISGLTPAVPFRQEGRSRVVTNAGWDVENATASARHGGRGDEGAGEERPAPSDRALWNSERCTGRHGGFLRQKVACFNLWICVPHRDVVLTEPIDSILILWRRHPFDCERPVL